ncbi:hypothetical protein CW751_05175 [Brumimicrobium salinarum]|uniref:Sulfatase-modifying factor enzyme-like domain-containing protein n=2 Tax=Brumimicrobium salinarum TaxID=2058658 RepID=A0A2I0R567_9FLAO|nr:hypothetical protein CW751_05175 [Brumimicrobium salinarum]
MLVIYKSPLANNLSIGDVTLLNDSTLTFEISWENSWRTDSPPYNHDAVWLFVKKRDCGGSQWSHTDLSPVSTAHTASSPLEVYIDGKDASTNAKGLFVRRSSVGAGNISSSMVTLRVRDLPSGLYDFKVFGIEMVQIPQGAFYLGDGASYGSFQKSTTGEPYHVTSESSISNSNLSSLTTTSARPGNLPSSYPKGYNEVYCMKYELTQGQYTEFLNTIASDQAATRAVPQLTAYRLLITGVWPTIVATHPHRAMTNMIWDDLTAYLDWSALRPMTELEFEKIARGPATPVKHEKAWGTPLIVGVTSIVTDGTATESASNTIPPAHGISKYNNTTPHGPMRVGFAGKPGNNRHQSGASYYGVMDLSGNASETVVGSVHANGTSFVGNLGDGEITTTPTPGIQNVSGWPNYLGRTLRGGSWRYNDTYLSISDRSRYNYYNNSRYNYVGGRGVR